MLDKILDKGIDEMVNGRPIERPDMFDKLGSIVGGLLENMDPEKVAGIVANFKGAPSPQPQVEVAPPPAPAQVTDGQDGEDGSDFAPDDGADPAVEPERPVDPVSSGGPATDRNRAGKDGPLCRGSRPLSTLCHCRSVWVTCTSAVGPGSW